MSPDVITIIGATIQMVGIWALTVLMFLVSRALHLNYLRTWASGWLWLAASLTALQLGFRWPAGFPFLQLRRPCGRAFLGIRVDLPVFS